MLYEFLICKICQGAGFLWSPSSRFHKWLKKLVDMINTHHHKLTLTMNNFLWQILSITWTFISTRFSIFVFWRSANTQSLLLANYLSRNLVAQHKNTKALIIVYGYLITPCLLLLDINPSCARHADITNKAAFLLVLLAYGISFSSPYLLICSLYYVVTDSNSP